MRSYVVSVLPESPGQPATYHSFHAKNDDDALLQAMGHAQMSPCENLELAKSYCKIFRRNEEPEYTTPPGVRRFTSARDGGFVDGTDYVEFKDGHCFAVMKHDARRFPLTYLELRDAESYVVTGGWVEL